MELGPVPLRIAPAACRYLSLIAPANLIAEVFLEWQVAESQTKPSLDHQLSPSTPRRRGAGRHLHHGPSQLTRRGKCCVDASDVA